MKSESTLTSVDKGGKTFTAQDLRQELSGSHKQRMEEEKTILLRYIPGQRPEVMFTGFWTGKFIRAAISSISKAYRQRRKLLSTPQRPLSGGDTNPKGKGE